MGRRLRIVAVGVVVFLVLLGASVALQAELPAPDGPYTVGRSNAVWVDPSRNEVATADPGDRREVPVEIWYPGVTSTGAATAISRVSTRSGTGFARAAKSLPSSSLGCR